MKRVKRVGNEIYFSEEKIYISHCDVIDSSNRRKLGYNGFKVALKEIVKLFVVEERIAVSKGGREDILHGEYVAISVQSLEGQEMESGMR